MLGLVFAGDEEELISLYTPAKYLRQSIEKETNLKLGFVGASLDETDPDLPASENLETPSVIAQ